MTTTPGADEAAVATRAAGDAALVAAMTLEQRAELAEDAVAHHWRATSSLRVSAASFAPSPTPENAARLAALTCAADFARKHAVMSVAMAQQALATASQAREAWRHAREAHEDPRPYEEIISRAMEMAACRIEAIMKDGAYPPLESLSFPDAA